MRSSFATISLLAALASAQTINPTSVPIATRDQWCVSQKAACPELCAQQSKSGSMATASNTCDPTTLDYSCVCSNGISPNATEYSQTIPYFICTEYNNECVTACGQDNSCSAACRQDHPCGAQDPTRVNTSTISTSATATTGTATGSGAAATTTGLDTFGGSGSGGSSSSSKTTGSSSAALRVRAFNFGQTYGFVAVVAGLFAGFGLML